MNRSDAPLREEILMLRKKVVQTTKANNDRLKKELNKITITMHEERSQLELNLMNQLSNVTRENALKVEEINVRLQESNNMNRALNHQLESRTLSAKAIEKRFQDVESQHQEEGLLLMNESKQNSIVLERMKRELNDVQKVRDALVARLKEFTNLKDTTKQSEHESNELHLMEEKLKSRDIEVTKNIGEISRLNLELEELRSQSISTLEIEKQRKRLENELNDATDGQSEIESTIACLETENDNLKETLLSNSESKIEAEKNYRALMKQLEVSIAVQKEKDAVTIRFEDKIQQLKNQVELLQKENGDIKVTLQNNDRGEKFSDCDSIEKDTTISQLENEVQVLRRSFKQIENENSELKNSFCNESSGIQTRGFGRLQPNVYPEGLQMASGTIENQTSRIIKRLEENLKYEDQMKRNSVTSIETQTTNDKTSEVRLHKLKAPVINLNQQLENGWKNAYKLRKAIPEFTTSTPVDRMVDETDLVPAVMSIVESVEKKEIDRLMMKIANVKSQFFNSDQARSELQDEIGSTETKYSENIEMYKAQLELAQTTVHNITLRMDKSRSFHKKEINEMLTKIDELQSKIDNKEECCLSLNIEYKSSQNDSIKAVEGFKSQIFELETELSTTQNLLMDYELNLKRYEDESKMLEKRNNALVKQKEEYRLSINNEYESSQKDNKKVTEHYKYKISELEAELFMTKNLLSDHKLKSSMHVEELISKLKSLEYIAENEIGLEEEAKKQHEHLKKLQKTVDEKLAKVEKAHDGERSQISDLRDQVKSLEQELTSTREKVAQMNKSLVEKHGMEFTAEEFYRKNSQTLHTQINNLQKQLTGNHMELSEVEIRSKKEITDLEEIINSLNVEMDEILIATDLKVEKLKNIFEEKDGMNQRVENEKNQLVSSINDMMKTRRDEMDDLQDELMGMSTRLVNKTREISALKLRLEESQYQTQEMGRLKATVTELTYQLTSKKGAEEEYDYSTLEIENSELRKRLRDVSAERWGAEEKL